MGSSCDCVKHYNEAEEKFDRGQGIYSFKKIVMSYNIINCFIVTTKNG